MFLDCYGVSLHFNIYVLRTMLLLLCVLLKLKTRWWISNCYFPTAQVNTLHQFAHVKHLFKEDHSVFKKTKIIPCMLIWLYCIFSASYCQRLLLFDGMSGDIRTIKLRAKKEDCPVCGAKPTITKLIDYEMFCGSCATDKVYL